MKYAKYQLAVAARPTPEAGGIIRLDGWSSLSTINLETRVSFQTASLASSKEMVAGSACFLTDLEGPIARRSNTGVTT